MAALAPCDLGDGIEVVHDVETLELEMECDVPETDDLASTVEIARLTAPYERAELVSTVEFARYSAPYERIELEVDAHAFRQATIEEARRLLRER